MQLCGAITSKTIECLRLEPDPEERLSFPRPPTSRNSRTEGQSHVSLRRRWRPKRSAWTRQPAHRRTELNAKQPAMKQFLAPLLTIAATVAAIVIIAPDVVTAIPIAAGLMIQGAGSSCTVSFPDPVVPYVVYTAAHCYTPGGSTVVHADDYRIGDYAPLTSNSIVDLIAIRLRSSVSSPQVLATGEPLLASRVANIGATVCKYAHRHESCGTVLEANSERFKVEMAAEYGDSGAPVYERDPASAEDGVHLVGILVTETQPHSGVITCSAMSLINSFLRRIDGTTPAFVGP